MKKTVLVIMMLLMLFFVETALASTLSEDAIKFHPSIMSELSLSARELFSTSESRAAFTVVMASDCRNEGFDFDFAKAMVDTSYVAYSPKEHLLYIVYVAGDESCMISYNPAKGDAEYERMESLEKDTNIFITETMFDLYGWEYHKNSTLTIITVLEGLVEAIEGI